MVYVGCFDQARSSNGPIWIPGLPRYYPERWVCKPSHHLAKVYLRMISVEIQEEAFLLELYGGEPIQVAMPHYAGNSVRLGFPC